jgi:plasmid stability protein
MKRNVYLRVPDALHYEARVFAATHRKGVNELYLEALRAYLVREAERAAAGPPTDAPDA